MGKIETAPKRGGVLKNLWFLISTFSRPTQVRLVLYLCAQALISLMDMVGIAMVLPVTQVLMGADLDQGNLGVAHRMVGNPSTRTFTIELCVAMVLAFLIKAVVGTWLSWWSTGFVARLSAGTSSRLLRAFLHEDYLSHKGRDVAEVIRNVGPAVQSAHTQSLGGMINLSGLVFSSVTVMILLLIITPLPTLLAIIYFGILILFIQKALGRRNADAGHLAQKTGWEAGKALVEAMNGFREINVQECDTQFIAQYAEKNAGNANASRLANFYTGLPKIILEFLTIMFIAIVLIIVSMTSDPSSAMATMTVFVAAAIKLLPNMSAITASIGMVRFGAGGLDITVKTLKNMSGNKEFRSDSPLPTHEDVIKQVHRIGYGQPHPVPVSVTDLSFTYPDGTDPVLQNITIDIPAGTSLALCGLSGSGKTTLIDILLGLIPYRHGVITFDGVDIQNNMRSWHDHVAYVPQDVYILDSSIDANIAFGIPEDAWDRQRIVECIKAAQLTDVASEFESGRLASVGERGAKLSGGQRQRIGIARALYRNPSVLVLDEATSALDNETEAAISNTIHSLQGEVTTVLVAHRLSTVRDVDQLVYLENGHIAARGTFSEVQKSSRSFTRLVELGSLDREVPRDER